MTEKVNYELDPNIYFHFLIFSDGMEARIVKTIEDLGDKWRFFVIPTESLTTMWRLKEGEITDSRYNRDENWYELEIDKEWVKQLNFHPLFTRWRIYSNWDLEEFKDDMESDRGIYVNRIARLKESNRRYLKQIKSLEREGVRMAKFPNIRIKEANKQVIELVKELKLTKEKEDEKR